MITPRMSAADVSTAAASLLGAPIADVAPLPASYANETWRVATTTGTRYVIKIGPLSLDSKWRAAHRALELAGAAGVPVAPLVSCAQHAGRLVRAFDWEAYAKCRNC